MNKRKKFILFIISGIVLVGSIILVKNSLVGTRPFKNLSMDEIESVSVWVIPPDITVELTKEETNELVNILHDVKIYNRTWRYIFSAGQSCVFTLTFKDSSVMQVNAYNPFMIIDGKGYRTEYQPCEELNQLGNRLVQEQEMTMYEKFSQLNIDTRLIGLEKGNYGEYFCTPVNASIIGWENSIHYCFIDGYDEMVFAVNPESTVDTYVYPVAENFEDFLRLILVCGSTTAVEQIVGWDGEQFGEFLMSDDNAFVPGQEEVLDAIRDELELEPMEAPFEYVKKIQKEFDGSKIVFSNEYYDTLGLKRPDGTENDIDYVEFESVTFQTNRLVHG